MAKKDAVIDIIDNPAATTSDILEETISTVGKTLDIMDEQVDKVVTITKNNPFVIGTALLVGLGIGGFVAYRIAKKRTTAVYEEEILPEQIRMAQAFRTRLAKEEFETPEEAAQALIPDGVVDTMKTYQGREGEPKVAYHKIPPSRETVEATPEATIPTEEPVATAVDRNVFSPTSDPRDWDYNAEIAAREENPEKPFVISREEHEENIEKNDQVTLTWYEKDDTLADERSQPIDDVEGTVGDDNLERFGHGSDDVNVVYVRNERLGMDFEIIRDPGSFAKEVLGLDDPEPTLKHSHQRSRGRRHRADE